MTPETAPAPRITVVVPVLNEVERIGALLRSLREAAVARAVILEIVVVDGGSVDGTVDAAAGIADRVEHTAAGRSIQLQRGLDVARAPWVWFLHADASEVAEPLGQLLRHVDQPVPVWGFFRVRLRPAIPGLGLVQALMNLRSASTGVGTGDQGQFVRTALLRRLGGLPRIPLMEDVELSLRLRELSRPLVLPGPLGASSRRWQRDGLLRTVLLMWSVRLRYWLGEDPESLARRYYPRAEGHGPSGADDAPLSPQAQAAPPADRA